MQSVIKECPEISGDFRKHLYEKFKTLCNKYKTNINQITKDQFNFFIFEIRCRTAFKMTNYANMLCYSLHIYSQNDLTKISLKIPQKYKSNSKFQLKLMQLLYPDVIKVKFCSWMENYEIDQGRLERVINRPVKNGKNTILRNIKNRLSNFPHIESWIKIAYMLISPKYSTKDANELLWMVYITNRIIKRVNRNKFSMIKLKNIDKHGPGRAIYAQTTHYLQLLELIGYYQNEGVYLLGEKD